MTTSKRRISFVYLRKYVMPAAALGRWGNSLAIRIPGAIAAAAKLTDGDRVEIEAVEDAIIIRAAAPSFTAKSLFEGRSAGEWRAEYANAYDWGPDVLRPPSKMKKFFGPFFSKKDCFLPSLIPD